ncbi:MAG: site-specific integrase [Gammaproteobacteria bacterium]|nr:site-specific integrase [Gammaproteobacteria bacterium]
MTTTNKLSNVAVKNAKTAPGQQRMLSDGNRLYLRVRNRAGRVSKEWMFIYTPRPGAAQRKLGFGSYPTVTLERARQKADEARKLLTDGIDPQIERQAQAAKRASADTLPQTVSELFRHWHALALAHRKDGGKEIKRAFDKDVLPKIGGVSLKNIRRGHTTAVLDEVLARDARRLANRLLSEMRQMFKFGVIRDLVAADPTYGITKNDVGGRDTERERVLSEGEIQTLKAALPSAKLPKPTELAVWIMLSTCCRVGELSKAKWSEIDLHQGSWVIPADNSKNKRPHTVFLSAFALKQFKSLRALCTSNIWAYPNRADDTESAENVEQRHINLKTIVKQLRDRQRTKALDKRTEAVSTLNLPGGDWVPHDLRRTGATLMASLGVLPAVIERCLNHLEQNRMTRIYQRHDFSVEQRQAWEMLGQRLELLTCDDTSNVVSLRTRKLTQRQMKANAR